MNWPSCDHLFHQDCVGEWRNRNETCPLCRGKDEKLIEENAAHRAQRNEEESADEARSARIMEHFRRRLLQIGTPSNALEEIEVARLTRLFQARENAYDLTLSDLGTMDQAQMPAPVS
ncbi:uncharacterized protein PGTG_14973 [Puccinia graminis f. sp. tritici CRL 75-36-700-3]|uniref:RING-type domain-containing protein n=1 Tax=Puccinia graminis f. sp. tritici (strain CRL 75-36-700-3 / race SCCL) TaxID=418459 RepID=E3KXS0_PUCGT|nr:uncharacterized protein PGTG_14973 [Puccinia graminis f. sp. tritici CRL 75-36-700-3]EFP89132.2 hypothetical protein PGTG_14973 [Puccinia graminis f. sp. tritici CRL 75-36-700-3]